MTKQKKSFLDKIINPTGDKEDNVEEQAKVNNVNEENFSEEHEEKFDADKALKDIENEAMNSSDKSAAGYEERGADERTGDKKEWFGDKESGGEEEGQLTVDVYQTDDQIVIKSIIGGVRSEDLDISVTSDMVTIKGTRKNYDDVKPENYYYQECFWGIFSRSIILPCDIKTDGVEAMMKNGVLTVKLPKIEKNSSKKIQVIEE